MTDLAYKPENLAVVVADGHDSTRKGIVRVLAKMGFVKIIEAHDGLDVLRIKDEETVDLFICDVSLRKKSGFEVLRSIRQSELNNDIPVIIVTGESSRDDIVKAADQGANEYILKPFQPVDLEKKISAVLDGYFAPDPLTQMMRAAEKLVRNKDYDQALKLLDTALKDNAESIRARHIKALVLDRLGRMDDAFKLLKDNVRINQNYYKTYAVLADLCLRKNQNKEAIDYMRREVELNAKNFERQIQLARLLFGEGDIVGTMHHFREALKEAPKNKSALFGMGQVYAADNNLDKGIYYFRRLRRHHPDSTKALEAIVKYAMEAKEPRKAELALREERSTHPEKMDVHIVLTKLYAATERDELAIETIDKALLAMPENVDGLRIKAALHARMKDYEQAIATYELVLKKQMSTDVIIRLAEIYLITEKFGQAIDVVHKGLARKEDLGKLFGFLGDAYLKSQQFTKAFMAFSCAVREGNDSPEVAINIQQVQKTILGRHQQYKAPPRKIAS